MASPALGTKRRCVECDAAFYDLNRDPITCPKCGAVHQPVARLKSDGRTPPKGRVFPKRQPEPALEPAGAAEAPDTLDKDFDTEGEAAEDEAEDGDEAEAEDGSDTATEDKGENRRASRRPA